MNIVQDNIEILYSLDENGVSLLRVSLYSLLKYKHPSTKYNVVIAHKNISDNSIRELRKIANIFLNVNIQFINCQSRDDQYELSKIFKTSDTILKIFWPSPMYYYFLAPLFYQENVKKILYLDIDTIIQKDLAHLFSVNFNTTFAGVVESVIVPYIIFQNEMRLNGKMDEVEIKYDNFIDDDPHKYDAYLNSGVLLINMDRLRNNDFNKMLEIMKAKHLPDQDVIGYYFYNDITNLTIQSNFCIHFFTDQIIHEQSKIHRIPQEQVALFKN
jgi:lipopolysaccharide biosynthesis glycosyltransferase